MADTGERMRDNALAILRAEPDRTADARMEIHILGQRRKDDALGKFGLDEDGRVVAACAGLRADVKRDVRPRGLGDVLDDRAEAQITLDE